MKVGLIFDLANPAPWRRPGAEVYAEALTMAEEVEALGYDSIWLTEHHFTEDWNGSSILPIAAAIAARTSTIRIGSWALLLALHDPLRVAEDTLAVDQIADGRFELGVAAGYRVEEFAGFGVARRERRQRMEDGLTALRQALRGERVNVDGSIYRWDDVDVTPPPARGEVKLWSGGQTEGPCERAARHRCHFMPSGPFVQPLYDVYASQLLAQGDDPAAFEMIGFHPWFVSNDPAATAPRIVDHLRHRMETYRKWYEDAADFKATGSGDFVDKGLVAREEDPLGGVLGTPEEIHDSVLEFHGRAPYTEVISWVSPIGLDAESAMKSIRLFARELLPELQKVERGSVAVSG